MNDHRNGAVFELYPSDGGSVKDLDCTSGSRDDWLRSGSMEWLGENHRIKEHASGSLNESFFG